MNLELQLLTDPKKKLTAKLQKRFNNLRSRALKDPWWKARPTRVDGISDKLSTANAHRDSLRRPAGFIKLGPPPSSEGLKIVRRLSRLSLHKLDRFVKQSARRAATAFYRAQKTKGPHAAALEAEQARQMALYHAGIRMIEFRLTPPQKSINQL